MQFLTTTLLALSLLSQSTLSAPTTDTMDAMSIIAIPDTLSSGSPCQCVRYCYVHMWQYCNSCADIKDQQAQFQCFVNPCCECMPKDLCGL
ncbi:hypothetical protein VTL71DRAFT_5495 [Oculimacula yallundae]|uniref:Uncharacterized protein n=1 Tax=Oculimacula yallundae TaxID=86028 RepID=A0ABR4C1A4_9HELO